MVREAEYAGEQISLLAQFASNSAHVQTRISFHSTSFEQSTEVTLLVITFNQVHKVQNSEYKW